jgi:DNA-binding XRE family transcriptional regulator
VFSAADVGNHEFHPVEQRHRDRQIRSEPSLAFKLARVFETTIEAIFSDEE